MASYQTSQADSAKHEYTPRAAVYDDSNHGWHAELADDFCSWIKPRPSDAVLDVACGTGLVTLRMADQVGRGGLVVGVDVTPAMLDVGRAKLDSESGATKGKDRAKVEFVEADITDPSIAEIEAIKDVIEHRGGFDIVSCCSALVLLDDPTSAIKLWTSLLKSGGRLIVDATTERPTVQYLATERLGKEMGISFPFSRAWVKGRDSVEEVLKAAGLEVELSLTSKSYLPERVFTADQRDQVFEEDVLGRFGKVYIETGKVDEARRAWEKIWDEVVGEQGSWVDGHWLYVCVGRKT